jgi:phosphotransferase system  glucose/maltose/N-acetylglucosamine-specific IIC component
VNGRFYQTDYTQALLFMGDGTYLSGLAQQANLTGSQWGMMNETGSYPGQTWLWLYTMWYQVPPFTSTTGFLGFNTSNADLGIILLMTLLTVALALVPLIPVLRDIPRWVPLHRLIWRDYYAGKRTTG